MSLALTSVKAYAPLQFSLWRIAMGAYVAYYSAAVIPYAVSLYSREGMLPDPSLNYLYGLVPNLLYVFDTPPVVLALCVISLIAGLCIMVGFWRAPAALVAWLISVQFFGRNVLTDDPSFAFVGLLLVLLVLIPAGEPWSLERRLFGAKKEWYLPSYAYWGAWVVIGAAFTLSGGLRLLASPSWQDGTAMLHILSLPIAYQYWLTDWLRSLPLWAIQLQTWSALFVYLISLPCILFRRTRILKWVLWVGMFSYVLVTLDLLEVTLGMFLYFFFLFDYAWVLPRKDLGRDREGSYTP